MNVKFGTWRFCSSGEVLAFLPKHKSRFAFFDTFVLNHSLDLFSWASFGIWSTGIPPIASKQRFNLPAHSRKMLLKKCRDSDDHTCVESKPEESSDSAVIPHSASVHQAES